MSTESKVRATCPACGNGVRADRARLALPVKCPKCGETDVWQLEEPPAPKPKLAPPAPRIAFKQAPKQHPRADQPSKTVHVTPEVMPPEAEPGHDPNLVRCINCGIESYGVFRGLHMLDMVFVAIPSGVGLFFLMGGINMSQRISDGADMSHALSPETFYVVSALAFLGMIYALWVTSEWRKIVLCPVCHQPMNKRVR